MSRRRLHGGRGSPTHPIRRSNLPRFGGGTPHGRADRLRHGGAGGCQARRPMGSDPATAGSSARMRRAHSAHLRLDLRAAAWPGQARQPAGVSCCAAAMIGRCSQAGSGRDARPAHDGDAVRGGHGLVGYEAGKPRGGKRLDSGQHELRSAYPTCPAHLRLPSPEPRLRTSQSWLLIDHYGLSLPRDGTQALRDHPKSGTRLDRTLRDGGNNPTQKINETLTKL